MKFPNFKRQKNFRKGGFHTNPDVCWEIVIYVAFVVTIGVLIYGVYLFHQIDKNFSAPDLDASKELHSVNQDRINQDLQFFSARDAKSLQILTSPAPFVDPSL